MGVLRSLYERIVGRYDPAPVGTGDVLVVSNKAVGRLAANGISDGWVLTRDSAATEGIKWAAPGGAAGDHALLSSLPWAASAHTGTPNRLAVFDGAGSAAYAAIPLIVANGGTGSTNAPDARTALGVAIGSDVQAYSGLLAAIAGLTPAANRLQYWTGAGSAALTDLTPYARTLLDDADQATARTTLGAADATLSYVLLSPDPSAPGALELVAGALTAVTSSTTVQIDTYFSAEQLIAGRSTAGPGVGEELTISEVLDWLSSTRGAVLYRGASAWLALPPGTAGHVLTTQGAGADPSWQAAGGGSGLSQAQILSRASLRA